MTFEQINKGHRAYYRAFGNDAAFDWDAHTRKMDELAAAAQASIAEIQELSRQRAELSRQFAAEMREIFA